MTSGISKLRPDETKDEPPRNTKTISLARRNSFQTGSIKPKRWSNGDKGYTIRYRLRDPNNETGWRYKRESLRGVGGKQAKRILAGRLSKVNAINNDLYQQALSMTFADFVAGLWKNYLANKMIKPSTAYSYDSMIENTWYRRSGLCN
jgi:hypothetical protein